MSVNNKSCNLRVSYLRDGLAEEFHDGIVQFYPDKCVNYSPYYLRSCAKPLQACLLIDCGINFTPEEIAFCSGSHAGELCHVEIANKILKKIGLSEKDLKCGIHAPLSRTMQDKMLLNGERPSQIHNNCSGKHLGFLAICLKNGWSIDNYYETEHPLQIMVREKLYELCEVTEKYPLTTDGCGVPIVSMPLFNLAKGYVNLNRQYTEIADAIIKYPYIFGGENRLDTEIIMNSDGLLAKVGAGGLCTVLNTRTNEAFVIKMYDASMEARRYAALEFINRIGWGSITYDNSIKTLSGKLVGNVEIKFIN